MLPKSPCIGLCKMNDLNQLCKGCYRSINEITDWRDLSREEQETIVNDIPARKEAELRRLDQTVKFYS